MNHLDELALIRAKSQMRSSSIPDVLEELQFPGNPEVMLTQAIHHVVILRLVAGLDPLIELRRVRGISLEAPGLLIAPEIAAKPRWRPTVRRACGVPPEL
jgi:hypothetical protein